MKKIYMKRIVQLKSLKIDCIFDHAEFAKNIKSISRWIAHNFPNAESIKIVGLNNEMEIYSL